MKKIKLVLLTVLINLGFYTNAQQILLSGTSFDPINANDTARFYWGIGDIVYYGAQTGSLVMTTPFAPNVNTNVFNNTHYYAITNNPNKLHRNRYTNLVGAARDNQLVISKMPADGSNLFVYNVSNAQAYTNVTVKIDYCYVRSAAAPGCAGGFNSLKIPVNPDGSNTNGGTYTTYAQNAQFCMSESIVGTSNGNQGGGQRQVGPDGNISIFVNNAGSSNDTCKVVGIKSIEVWGTPKPRLKALDAEVCTKESIDLATQVSYSGATYTWQVNTGSGFTDIGTDASESYEPQTNGTYSFRLALKLGTNTFYSDTLTVNSIPCCMENGLPASRKDLFVEDFGRLDMSDPTGRTYYTTDYTDIKNPVQVKHTIPAGDPAYRWRAVPPPSGLNYAMGKINDGEYMIAANLTNATVDYANNITGTNPPPTQGYDHSGTKEGGVLLMNLTPSTKGNTLYNRKFENLCTGKQIFFEAYATVFTADPGVSIRTEIEDLNSGVVIKDSIKVNPVASGPAGTTGWKRISGSLTLTGSSPSLNFRIINNNPTNNTSGNDLALDDIKIKVCAPPSLDAYFDTVALSKTASACDLSKLDLFAKPSSLLRGYYGNNQLFLYQWTKTPEVLDSWKNIGTPIPGTSVLDVGTVASDTALTKSNPRGPIYFRIIAATSAVYGPKNNFQGSVANAANPNDPCSNYTVSDVIKLDISCVLPVSWVNFHGEKTTVGNRLTWATIKNTPNDYFIIQKSVDGSSFYEIGRLQATKSGGAVKTQVFYDEKSTGGYYRIKQVGADGQFTYSKTIFLDSDAIDAADVYIFPNPNAGTFIVSGLLDAPSAKVEIFDLNGKAVFFNTDGVDELQLKISGLSKGIYLVKISTEYFVDTKKIVVY